MYLNFKVSFQVFFLTLLLILSEHVVYRFFKESSEEEREHAEKLMEYQVYKTFNLFRIKFLMSANTFFFFLPFVIFKD